MTFRILLAAAFVWSCTGSGPTPDTLPDTLNTDALEDSAEAFDSLMAVMPDVPAATPGHLALVTAARKPEYRVAGEWSVTVHACSALTAIQALLFEPEFGFGLVLGLPDTGSTAGDYEFTNDTDGLPRPRTVRMAMQMYSETRSYGLPVISADVRVDSVADSLWASIQATMLESVFLDTVRAGVRLEGVPIEAGTDAACRVIGEPEEVGEGPELVPIGGA